VPRITVPEMDLDELSEAAAHLAKAVQDGAYVAIGFGVLAWQRAQLQRVEFQRQVESYLAAARESTASADMEVRLEAVRSQLASAVRGIDGQVGPARRQIDDGVDRLEAVLPDQAREMVKMLRVMARRREQDLRAAVGLDQDSPDPGSPTQEASMHEPPSPPSPVDAVGETPMGEAQVDDTSSGPEGAPAS
jgi:hypothetical protein